MECGRQNQVSMAILWMWDAGAQGDVLSQTAGMGLGDCGFPLSLLGRKAPKALETKLRDFNPVW